MTGTTQEPTLDQRLSEARTTEHEARAHLDGLTGRLAKAHEEQAYEDAADLKRQIPEAEHAWSAAAATLRAYESVAAQLAQDRAAREQAEADALRRRQAIGHLNEASAREHALMDDLTAVKAEILAGLGAIRDAVARGKQLELQVRQARADQQQARIDAGDQQLAGAHVPAPNLVTVMVERIPALRELLTPRDPEGF
jgi:chromosome segregation ATPase